jgi:hypothetical protein
VDVEGHQHAGLLPVVVELAVAVGLAPPHRATARTPMGEEGAPGEDGDCDDEERQEAAAVVERMEVALIQREATREEEPEGHHSGENSDNSPVVHTCMLPFSSPRPGGRPIWVSVSQQLQVRRICTKDCILCMSPSP